MLLLRLIKGLFKGLVVGALFGWGLAALGFAVPNAIVAYITAVLVGSFMALVAGKPIWAKDARIEVGAKAVAGALLGPGLMWLVRRFMTMGLPFDASVLPGVGALPSDGVSVGMFAVTSLALMAGVVGAFYDADNQPGAADEKAPATKARIAVSDDAAAEQEAAEAEAMEAEAATRQQRR